MGMREVVLAALVGALIVIAAVAVPALALESPGFHAVVYPVALALFVPYAWLTLPAVLKEGHEMTALYALFVSMAIATVWAIGELSGRSIGRMRLIVLEGALVSVMALSFASVLISLGVTNTLILSSPLAVAAMIYIVAALVGIVPPEGVEAGISDNAATASIPSNIEVETIISRDEEKEQTQTPPSVEIHENLPTICIENTEEETPSIPAIVVPEEAGEEPVPAINCEAEAPATAEEAAVTEEPLIIAEEEAPAPVVIEEEPIPAMPAEPAIIAEEEAIPAETVAITEEETIPAESDQAEEIVIEEPVEEVLIEEEPAIIEPEVIAEASPAEEIAEPAIAEEEEIIPVEKEEPVLVEDAEPVIIEEEPAPIAAIEEDVIQIPRPPAITVSSRLSVPTAPTLTNTAKLEEPRVPSAPSLSNTAELVEETYQPARVDIFEDDFWSTFYIAGQDDLELEDGIYYMDLYINGSYAESVRVEVVGENVSVLTSDLKKYLADLLTVPAYNRVFESTDEYLTIEYLNGVALSASCDTADYRVDINFSGMDLPVQVLSLRGHAMNRIHRRPISGGITLDPAVFVLSSRYQLTFGISSFNSFNWRDMLQFHLTSSNSARLYDLYLDFNYYADFGFRMNRFRMGNYRFHVDFPDEMIRLQWGNVSPDLLSPSGTSVGIKFDKSRSYGNDNASRRSQVERLLVIDKESDVTVYNEGREIYRGTLQPGQYRLEDFTLYTGTNRIKIIIKPLDGSAETEILMDINYSSSLYAPGEFYYGAALSTGRKELTSSTRFTDGAVRIPIGSSHWLEYDWRNLAASGYIKTGLTESLSLDATLALANRPEDDRIFNPSAALSLQLTQASILGTTRYNLKITEDFFGENGNILYPDIYARLGHQIYTGIREFNAVNISAVYDGYNLTDRYNHRLSFNLGFSGTFGVFGYSINGNTGFDLPWEDLTYSASASFYLNAVRNLSLSASATIYGNNDDIPHLSWSVYGSYRFGKGTVSASATNNRYSANASATFGDHGISFRTETTNIARFNDYRFEASYNYSGDYLRLGIDADTSDAFKNNGLDFTLSTSTLFADGLFTISSYVPTNFVLISQQGALKGNNINVGAAGSSVMRDVRTLWGVSLYTGLPSSGDSSFSIYSQGDNSFGNFASFDFNIKDSARTGYVARISAESKYSVSGVIKMSDGSLWINGASPLYKLTINDGEMIFDETEAYVFTDGDGRFTLSDLLPGMYAFDVPVGNKWIVAFFNVRADEDRVMDVQLLKDGIFDEPIILPEIYSGFKYMDYDRTVTNDEFWDMIYGSWEVDAI